MENKVSREVAEKEINSWLEFKKISQRKREANKASIETLVEAIMEGTLALKEEDKVLVHTLKFDTGGDKPVTKLEYRPRLNVKLVKSYLLGVRIDDADGRICAYIAALTSMPIAIIDTLDSEDYSLSQAVAIFFL